jgi:hypothetical protein
MEHGDGRSGVGEERVVAAVRLGQRFAQAPTVSLLPGSDRKTLAAEPRHEREELLQAEVREFSKHGSSAPVLDIMTTVFLVALLAVCLIIAGAGMRRMVLLVDDESWYPRLGRGVLGHVVR